MGILTREAILSANDLKTEMVKVPEWGGEVIVSMMTAATRDAWEMSLVGDGKGNFNTVNMSARLLSHCAVDEKGNRLFNDKDAEALGRRSAKAMNRCVRVIQRLNGLTDADLEAAKGN
jgi:hypothetical protein